MVDSSIVMFMDILFAIFRPPAFVNPYPWPGWSALPGCLTAVQHFAWRSCVQQGNCWPLARVVLHLLAGARAEG